MLDYPCTNPWYREDVNKVYYKGFRVNRSIRPVITSCKAHGQHILVRAGDRSLATGGQDESAILSGGIDECVGLLPDGFGGTVHYEADRIQVAHDGELAVCVLLGLGDVHRMVQT